jgi:hypothetical protein
MVGQGCRVAPYLGRSGSAAPPERFEGSVQLPVVQGSRDSDRPICISAGPERCAEPDPRSALGPCHNGPVRAPAVFSGHQRAGTASYGSSQLKQQGWTQVGRSDCAPEGQGSSLPPAAASPPALAHEAVVTGDGPHPPANPGAVAAKVQPRRSRRPCHPRATSSGHQRYPAVSHGHSETALALGAGH